MYLNKNKYLSLLAEGIGLTLTWDVFKLVKVASNIVEYPRLTLTWDVFKFNFQLKHQQQNQD